MIFSYIFVTLAASCFGAAVIDEYERVLTIPPVGCNQTVTIGVTQTPDDRGLIQTPNFPSNYNQNTRCTYEIICDPREKTFLDIRCPSFELENSANCVNDRVTFTYKGSSEILCGTNSPDGTITTDGFTRFTFFSNGNGVTAKGFRCFVWCFLKPTTPAATTTTVPETTTMESTTADC